MITFKTFFEEAVVIEMSKKRKKAIKVEPPKTKDNIITIPSQQADFDKKIKRDIMIALQKRKSGAFGKPEKSENKHNRRKENQNLRKDY